MFDGVPGSSNGFFEKAMLFIVVVVSMFAAQMTDSGWLTLWCGFLCCIVLYLAWHFDIFNFTPEAWTQNEVTEWSQSTLGHAPTSYIEAVSNVRERIVPHHSVFWWFFRMVYVALGLSLLALAAEREFWATNHIATAIIGVLKYL